MKLTLILSLALNAALFCIVLALANRMGYLGRILVALGTDNAMLPTDTLASRPEWQGEVKMQVFAAQGHRYDVCLFGDSISSGLGYTLGDKGFNFAIGGMSTVSQLDQLKPLVAAKVKCRAVILAIGTNDAAYRVTDQQFVKNMKAIMAIAKAQLETQKFVILPAFYSTIAASQDPTLAAPLPRVNRINRLLQEIAVQEKASFTAAGLQPLFEGQALKQSLTIDGVHLNPAGEKIYRGALLKAIASL